MTTTPSGQGRPRPALRAARRRKRWSQAQAAEAVEVSQITWSRWERGTQEIRREHLRRIEKIFDIGPSEVDPSNVGSGPSGPFDWTAGAEGDSSLSATVDRAGELWRWDVDPSRRDLLAALPFATAPISDWLMRWSLDPDPESRAHQGPGRSVGMEDVHGLWDAYEAFLHMDHLFGGGRVRAALVDFLHTEVSPLLNGRYTDEVGSELMTAAACLTGMAGWEAYDLLKQGLAQAHFAQALQLAKAGDDPLTAAAVLGDLSQQAIDLEHPQWAVRFARAAGRAAAQAEACPRVQARVLLREARASARGVELATTSDMHTARRVQRLIAQAENAFAKARDDDDEPFWIKDMDAAELAGEAAGAWRMIGDHQRAAEYADQALSGFGPGFTRSIQLNRIGRAQAALGLGDLDHAIDLARSAVPLAKTLTSARSVQRVHIFDAALDPHARETRVREWRDYLRSELPATAA